MSDAIFIVQNEFLAYHKKQFSLAQALRERLWKASDPIIVLHKSITLNQVFTQKLRELIEL